MDFRLLADEDILKELGKRYDLLRRKKYLRDSDVSKKGGVSITSISKFKKGEGITLKNFIKILRGSGELRELEKLFATDDSYSPISEKRQKVPKKIFKKVKITKQIRWDENS